MLTANPRSRIGTSAARLRNTKYMSKSGLASFGARRGRTTTPAVRRRPFMIHDQATADWLKRAKTCFRLAMRIGGRASQRVQTAPSSCGELAERVKPRDVPG